MSRLIHGQISDDKPVGFGGPRPDTEICKTVTSTFCSCCIPASRLCLFSTLRFFLCGIVFDRMQSFTLSIQVKVALLVSCQILFNTFKIFVVFSGGFIQTKPMQLVRQKKYLKNENINHVCPNFSLYLMYSGLHVLLSQEVFMFFVDEGMSLILSKWACIL